MTHDQPQSASPPAPEGYQQQYRPQYAPPPAPKKKPEEMISNGLLLAIVVISGILILLGAILVHATGFLDDPELVSNITIVTAMLADVALFMLVVFALLAAILRSDLHHWVRASLVAFGAVLLLFLLTAIYGASGLIIP